MPNTIELSGIFSEGYGFVPKKLMKANQLKSNTKLLFHPVRIFTMGVLTAPQAQDIAEALDELDQELLGLLEEKLNSLVISCPSSASITRILSPL